MYPLTVFMVIVILNTFLIGFKVIYVPLRWYNIILHLVSYFPLPVKFTLSYAFVFLFSVFKFKLEQVPLALLVS